MYEINPPNNGTLSDPLTLKFNLSDHGSFDIAPKNNTVTTDIGLGLFRIDGKSTLFSIEIETGEMKILARYDRYEFTAFAISPEY